MSQAAQEVASNATFTATAPLALLATYQAFFNFGQSSTSTRTATVPLQNVPVGAKTAIIANQAFNIYYTNNEQYGYGALQVSLSTSLSQASCTVTLRDNNTNKRVWEGTVTGIVSFFG